jgi:hypothetical protein
MIKIETSRSVMVIVMEESATAKFEFFSILEEVQYLKDIADHLKDITSVLCVYQQVW